jgi:putative ABC transport system permease protein
MIISMAIAGLGLFGMVMLFTQQRIKEVGIRKVMGATQGSLMNLLSRKYLLIVVAGNIVAAYPAWFFTRQWLEQFAFRIDLNATPFIVSLVFSLGLSLISIGWVIYKTIRTNPVSILRYE